MRSEGYGTWCVCVRACVCVCVCVRSISATTSKSKPENDTNASSRQDKVRSISATTSKSKLRKRYHRDETKRIKLAIFLKMLRSKVMASFAHFVGGL